MNTEAPISLEEAMKCVKHQLKLEAVCTDEACGTNGLCNLCLVEHPKTHLHIIPMSSFKSGAIKECVQYNLRSLENETLHKVESLSRIKADFMANSETFKNEIVELLNSFTNEKLSAYRNAISSLESEYINAEKKLLGAEDLLVDPSPASFELINFAFDLKIKSEHTTILNENMKTQIKDLQSKLIDALSLSFKEESNKQKQVFEEFSGIKNLNYIDIADDNESVLRNRNKTKKSTLKPKLSSIVSTNYMIKDDLPNYKASDLSMLTKGINNDTSRMNFKLQEKIRNLEYSHPITDELMLKGNLENNSRQIIEDNNSLRDNLENSIIESVTESNFLFNKQRSKKLINSNERFNQVYLKYNEPISTLNMKSDEIKTAGLRIKLDEVFPLKRGMWYSLEYLSNFELVAAGYVSGEIIIFQYNSEENWFKIIRTLRPRYTRVRKLLYSEENNLLLGAYDDGYLVSIYFNRVVLDPNIDPILQYNIELHKISAHQIYSLCLMKNLNILLFGGYDSLINYCHLTDLEKVYLFYDSTSTYREIQCLFYDEGKDILISSMRKNVILFFNFTSETIIYTHEIHLADSCAMNIKPYGKELIFCMGYLMSILIFRLASETEVQLVYDLNYVYPCSHIYDFVLIRAPSGFLQALIVNSISSSDDVYAVCTTFDSNTLTIFNIGSLIQHILSFQPITEELKSKLFYKEFEQYKGGIQISLVKSEIFLTSHCESLKRIKIN